jgi:2-polyprenyl-3-methyl-5-hydroxy-6-metoxy-1,4-benzoquinol methylase
VNWKNFWETKAGASDAALQVGRVVNGKVMDGDLMAKIAARVADELDLQASDTLLDVCCGNGALTRSLLPYCHQIVGVDFSEKLIQQAQNFQTKKDFGLNQNKEAIQERNKQQKDFGLNQNKEAIQELNKQQKDFGLNQNNDTNAEQKMQESAFGSDRKMGQEIEQDLSGDAHSSAIEFICGDAQDFVVEGQFDKVVLYFSFQYFESREMGQRVIENLLKHAKPGAIILLGDVTDLRNFFSYYHSPKKLSQWLKQQVLGKNDMGKFWHPDELLKICETLGVKGQLIEQLSWQPYAGYRFDFLIEKP